VTRREPAALDNLVVVLDHPKRLVNIAGVVRAMMNFGVGSLRLVEPDSFDPHRVEGIAHRSETLVAAATMHSSLAEALADCVWVLGSTARPRTEGRNYLRPRAAAHRLVKALEPDVHGGGQDAGARVAIVFGREDRGLTNQDLDLCHATVVVPTSPERPSLNLAQAVLLLLYEVFLAARAPRPPLAEGRRAERPPTHEEMEATYAALEQGLASIDFFKARRPSAIMRTLRTVIGRARPDLREARLLAAIGHEVRHVVNRRVDGSRPGASHADGIESPSP